MAARASKANLRFAQADKVKVDHARCRVFRHQFEGHVFQETVYGATRWVARIQCERCGTIRVDVMTVKSCELISRRYIHPEEYDTGQAYDEARQFLFKWMLDQG